MIVHEVKQLGIQVRLPDVNQSLGECTVEYGNIRLGLSYVKRLGGEPIECILRCREERPFTSLEDFCQRTKLSRRQIENLIMSGAMDLWGKRRELLWQLGQLDYKAESLDLQFKEDDVLLPSLSQVDSMLLENEVLGLSPGQHVMFLYRKWLQKHNILSSTDLLIAPNKQRVQTAGLVVVHQSPQTAKGFHFITLQDEFGMSNIIVSPQKYVQYRQTIRSARLLILTDKVQQENNVTNLIMEHATILPAM